MWALAGRTAIFATSAGVAAWLAGYRAGWGLASFFAISVAWLAVRATLVRVAHSNFRAGLWTRASLLYRIAGTLMLSRRLRQAARISRSACSVAAGDYRRALAETEALMQAPLDEPLRAAVINNRAYALARLGEHLDEALALSDEAVRLRPGMPGLRHTRGVVLLALGRFSDAIRELERVWRSLADSTVLLECERCYDLGVAWDRLGEREYALDYFDRARRIAPGATWAQRAESELERGAPRLGAVLPV